jgi:hypothetical protein
MFWGGMALNFELNSLCPKLFKAKTKLKMNKKICFISAEN